MRAIQRVAPALCAAVLVVTMPACSGSRSRRSPPPGPGAAGEFLAWQSLGGGHATRAMVVGDVDGDGDNDVFEVNYGEQCRLLVNNGAGELTDGTDLGSATSTGLPAMSALSRCAVFFDMDGDGDLDLILGNNGLNMLWRNNGSGEFTDATAGNLPPSVDDTWAIVALDVDGDTDRDLVIGNTGQNQLLLNDGKGKFFIGTDLAGTLSTGLPASSDATRGLVAVDVNSDTYIDLVVANDDGGQDRILLNNNPGTGEFTDGTFGASPGLPVLADNSRAVVVKNFDNTTSADLFFVGQGVPRLLLNNGSGFFRDATTDWTRQIPGQLDTWRGLYVASSTAIFAVGDNGTIRFNNGSGAWGNQGSGVSANLLGVGGASATNVYAVGDAGTMIAWSGSAWGSAITNPAQPSAPYPGDNLLGVTIVASAAGGSEYWTVGTNAMLAKSTNGTTWTQVTGSDNPVYTAAVTGPPYVPPSGPALRAVLGFTGSTDTIMYAVGDNGTILRKADGATAWSQLTSTTARHLYAIFATSATSLWAVGEGGTILRSTDGSSWTLQPSGTNRDLFGVYGASASDLWVVGRGGEVLVTTTGGATWTPDYAGTHADLYAVGGTSTTDVYAVGLLATIVRETGATSTTGVPTTPLQAWGVVSFDVNGDTWDDLIIATNGPEYVYLNYSGSVLGNFSDNSATALTNRPSDDTRGVSAALINGGGTMDLLWANTGQNRLDLGQAGGTFNDGTDTAGSGPTGLPLWFDARDGAVGDVSGDGVHDLVLAVRSGRNRLYVRQGLGFVDRTVTNMPADTDPSEGVVLVDVDGDGDLDIVFANNGTQNRVYTNNGSGVFTNAAGALPADTDPSVDVTFGDVDGDTDRDLVFANNGTQNRLLRNNGSGVFTDVTGTSLPVDTDPSQDVVLADVDNDGDRDLVVANGARWRVDSVAFTDNLYGVSAVSTTDIWAVGAGGRVAHWNGTGWTGTIESAANTNTLRAVYAIAQNDVVAVGDNATFIRYNGTSWSAEAAPSLMGVGDHLRSVHGTGPSDLHAVGVNGIICRNTGSGWTRIAQGVTPASLNGVVSVAGPLAVAVGQGTAPLAVVWNGTFWATLNPPGSPTLNAVAGVSGSEALTVGAGGVALRFRGFAWATVASGVTVNLNGLAAHAVGGVLAVGASGTAIRDTGAGFAAEAVGTVTTALNAVTWADSAHAVAAGDGGVLAQWQGARNRLLRNNGSGVFTDVTATALPAPDLDDTSDGTLADVDLDGDLDIFFANRRGQNRLYINNGVGSGNFSDGTDLTQVATTGLEPEADDSRAAMFLTARGTQWDLIVGVRGAQNRLLLNQGGGEFRDSTDEGNATGFGLVVDRADTYSVKGGDFDLDGLVDPVFVNAGGAVVLLHR